MPTNRKHITVFEHQSIKLDQVIDGVVFDEIRLKALQSFYGEKGVPYFSLIHKGIRFCEYVGVIQVGQTIFEVLPKADNKFAGKEEKKHWRDVLIDMIYASGLFQIDAPSSSALKLKNNTILDLYLELFIKEVEYLLHAGLAKKYRKKEGNVTALKGSLQFGKHIQQNLTHQERFYVRHTTYDVEHTLHFILYKTICLLQQINTNSALHSRIGTLLLHFPEMPDIKVTAATFEKLVYSRKTQSYKKAIDIAKMLLLQYHPDLSKGRNDVLALMFDMNKLWEHFVYATLRKHKDPTTTITAQTSKYFWKPDDGYHSKIRPDILINKDTKNCVVLDTKWKNLNGYNPSPADLRQMYVYHEYYQAKRVALVYPGAETTNSKGFYMRKHADDKDEKQCSVILLQVPDKPTPNLSLVKTWQVNILDSVTSWVNRVEETPGPGDK